MLRQGAENSGPDLIGTYYVVSGVYMWDLTQRTMSRMLL